MNNVDVDSGFNADVANLVNQSSNIPSNSQLSEIIRADYCASFYHERMIMFVCVCIFAWIFECLDVRMYSL